MVELLQLVHAGLAVTAVTVTVVASPIALLTGESLPDLGPLIEQTSRKDTMSK